MTPLRLLTLALVSAFGCLLAVAVAVGGEDPTLAPVASRVEPLAVLREWDRDRADAWRAGSVAALRRLYTPSSETGRADVRMLRAYAARGLRVEELVVQRADVEVRSGSADRWVLEVTDRVASATAVGDRVRTPLPADEWSAWEVSLRLVDGRWLVSDVRAAAPPPAPRPRPGR